MKHRPDCSTITYAKTLRDLFNLSRRAVVAGNERLAFVARWMMRDAIARRARHLEQRAQMRAALLARYAELVASA